MDEKAAFYPNCPTSSHSRGRGEPENIGQQEEHINVRLFRKMHDEAYLYVDNGLTCEENGNVAQASYLYRKGVMLIDHALTLHIPQSAASADVARMKVKMQATKSKIGERLAELRQSMTEQHQNTGRRAPDEQPPSYEDVMDDGVEPPIVPMPNQSNISATKIEGSIQERPTDRQPNASMIFHIPRGVRLFFISPTGQVQGSTSPVDLKVFAFTEQEQKDRIKSNKPPAFIKVGNWAYPFVPRCSPALKSDFRGYIFPDVTSELRGSCVGVMFEEGVVSAAQRSHFELILKSLTDLHVSLPSGAIVPTDPGGDPLTTDLTTDRSTTGQGGDSSVSGTEDGQRKSKMVSRGLVAGANLVARGVAKGAVAGARLIHSAGQKYRLSTCPAEQEVVVSGGTQRALEVATGAAHVAYNVSSYLADKLGDVATEMGRHLGPKLRDTVVDRVPDSRVTSKDTVRSTLEGAAVIASGGLQGFGTVYMSLEKAAKVLGKSVKNETVQNVEHSYGSQAAVATDTALDGAGRVLLAAHNVQNMGAKAVAKKAGAATAESFFSDVERRSLSSQHSPHSPHSSHSAQSQVSRGGTN